MGVSLSYFPEKNSYAAVRPKVQRYFRNGVNVKGII